MWYWHGMGWWWPALIVFLVLVVVTVLLVRVTGGPGGSDRRLRALDILDERLARGEIDPNEYEERRALLDRGN